MPKVDGNVQYVLVITTTSNPQPALSKQIKLLEKNLNVLLINRDKNKISLTEDGEILVQYSERILGLCEESCRALIDVQNGERGNLIVGASQTIGTYLMPKVVALFAQNYPQINLNVQVNSTRIIARNIINREIDIAVVGGEISDELTKNLKVEDFVIDEMSLIVPKTHPFAKQKIIKKEELYCLNFITLNYSSTIKRFIDTILTQNQIEPKKLKIILQLNSIEAIKTAVSVGLGEAFVSSSAIQKEIQLDTIEVIKIDAVKIIRKLYIISRPDSYKSNAFRLFYKELSRLKNKMDN